MKYPEFCKTMLLAAAALFIIGVAIDHTSMCGTAVCTVVFVAVIAMDIPARAERHING